MATTTMREVIVSSPAPAFTLPSGPVIDENQNNSQSNLKATSEIECTKDKTNQHRKKDTSTRNSHNDGKKDSSGQRSISPHSTSDETGKPLTVMLTCHICSIGFSSREALVQHRALKHSEDKGRDCSNHIEDCTTSNNLNSNSPRSGDSKSESTEAEDSVVKSLRSARRSPRWEDSKRKSDSDSEFQASIRRKHRSVNNNESADDDLHCSLCNREFTSWTNLQDHLQSAHPDGETPFEERKEVRKRIEFNSPRYRIDRKNHRNVPKIIGFQDINFIDFSSEKFPLVAKDVCEKSLHLSKDEFCFECQFCGRGFPCSSALDIHRETCEMSRQKEEKKVVKKNKRKSTPKFRPQAVTSESDETDDNIEVDLSDKRRNEFFNSLDLRNTSVSSKSSHKSSEDEGDRKVDVRQQRTETKPDLADIQSMISVTNIPGINVKSFATTQSRAEEKPQGLNLQVNTSQSSPGSFSSLSSPNFSMLNLISPSYSNSDPAEEEAQDCFAAECRRMKLRGEFPCKLCTQVFPNLRALKGHNRVHISAANGTTNSPYRCNICTYNSFDKATLVRHMRSHNGDRPYECAMCNYAFTTKANCERHLRNRHSKMTRDEVKNSIIYHPSEDPVNDSEYQKTSEMNKKNVEKSKENKPEYIIPVNLKINLAALKEKARTEDLFHSEHQELLKNMKNGARPELTKSEAGTMTEDMDEKHDEDEVTADDTWSGEEALDLRVIKNERNDSSESVSTDEPEDLSRKSGVKEFNNNLEEKPMIQEPPVNPAYSIKPGDLSNYVKMYSAMYPFLNINQIHHIILNFPGLLQGLQFPQFLMPQAVFHNANYAKNYLTKDVLGLQMSGGSIMDSKQKASMAQQLLIQQETLANIMTKREEEAYKKSSPTDYFEKSRSNEYFTESDKKAFDKIIVTREAEKTFTPTKPLENSIESRNTSVKMVIKNGVLMPKQKQRRYRTERPFSCEHCSARFTLRSNMERHIKQQHPQHWTQKSRYNVGSGRKPDHIRLQGLGAADYFKQYDSSIPASLLSRSEVSSTGSEHNWDALKSPKSSKLDDKSDSEEELRDFTDEEESKDDLIIDEEGGVDHMRLLANVSEYARAKQQEQMREEGREVLKESQPQDLASVSKMLDCASVTQTQAFQKYFHDGVRSKEEDECRREDGERSEEEEGLIAGSTSSDENRSESEASSSKTTKKKSAYSLAPNRVSCPYCFRKFPWTSSLRRHVLTHTGQKPFKCTHCPLLFTTKSNCDRHLLRKHGREALIASSGHTENTDGNGSNGSQSNSQNPNFTMRNVPERPYKCTYCPSSTFSSLSNLNKHMSSKHPNEGERSSSPDHTRVKNINPSAPPNVTISPSFPLNIPKTLSIIPQYPGENVKTKRFPLNVPSIRIQEWASACNGELDEEGRAFRKRSSSNETEGSDRKRHSPDLLKVSLGDSDAEPVRTELPPIPPSELPFKCHLCEGSFGERSEALEHIRLQHPTEFQLLMSKGALETTSEEDRVPHDDHDDVETTRGRFPDYANRKVMCAFCMRRFWSAEDLRRHMRTHTGERPFSCDVCHRKFTLKHSMLRHRKKHNAHDELIVGSDEEHHHNNNLPVSVVSMFNGEGDDSSRGTILLQTLTQRDQERKEDLRLSRESST